MSGCTTMARHATVFVTTCSGDDLNFVPTGEACDSYPYLLDADNLREARVISSRLDPDDSGRQPIPILAIDTTGDWGLDKHLSGRRRSVSSSLSVRLLVGLVVDTVLAGVADGVVIQVESGLPIADELRDEVARGLREVGLDVAIDLPGWVLAAS